jgi:hypothetical protein
LLIHIPHKQGDLNPAAGLLGAAGLSPRLLAASGKYQSGNREKYRKNQHNLFHLVPPHRFF